MRGAVAVGRDNRPSGDVASRCARRRPDERPGVDVVDIGVVPTPLLYWSLHHLGGRRRHPDHRLAQSARVQRLQALRRARVAPRRRDPGAATSSSTPGTFASGSRLGARAKRSSIATSTTSSRASGRSRGRLKVVVDCGNGAGALVAEQLFERLGRRRVATSSARATAHSRTIIPIPTVLENLEDLIAAVHARRRGDRHRVRRRRGSHRRRR